MTRDEYRALDALHYSAIKQGAVSMKHMRHYIESRHGGDDDESDELTFGTVVHGLVLEPGLLADRFAVWGTGRRQGNKWKAFQSANKNKTIIRSQDMADAEKCAAAVLADPLAADVLADTDREVPHVWTATLSGAQVQCKALFDAINPASHRLELKTCAASMFGSFEATAYRQGYHLQQGWYDLAAESLTGKSIASYVIAVESSEPWDVAVYRVDGALIEHARREALRIAREYVAARAAGKFDGTARGEMRALGLPPWVANRLEDRTVGELAGMPVGNAMDL